MEQMSIDRQETLDPSGVREELGAVAAGAPDVEGLWLCELAEAQGAAGAAVAAGLHPAEGGRRVRGGGHGLVHGDHPRVEASRDRARRAQVAAPDARREA